MRVSKTHTSGAAAEHLVLAALLFRGFEVTLPTVDLGADCHVKINGVWYSVQIKKCCARPGRTHAGTWSQWGGGNPRGRRGKGRVIVADLLALVNGTEVRFLPAVSPVPKELVNEN